MAHLGLSLIYFLGFNAMRTICVYPLSCVQGFRSENWACRNALSPPGLPPPLCWPLERTSSFLASVLISMYSPSPDLLQPPYWWWSLDLLLDLPIRSLLLIFFIHIRPHLAPRVPFSNTFRCFLEHILLAIESRNSETVPFIYCVYIRILLGSMKTTFLPFVCIYSMVFSLEFYVCTVDLYIRV